MDTVHYMLQNLAQGYDSIPEFAKHTFEYAGLIALCLVPALGAAIKALDEDSRNKRAGIDKFWRNPDKI